MSEAIKQFNSLIQNANKVYDEATNLKDIARKNKQNYKVYLQASNKFHQAGEMYFDAIKVLTTVNDNEVHNQMIEECKAFGEYYFYEKEQCITVYYYEQRNINVAKEHYKNYQKHIQNAIDCLSSIECDDRFTQQLAVWKYFQQDDIPLYNTMLARDAWDKGEVIEALDYYRESWEASKKVKELAIELVSKGHINPVYKRISIANNIGMAANISSAMSRNLYEKYGNSMPENYALWLLKLFWEGYCLSINAYSENPEWDDYLTGSKTTYKNICDMLKDNKNMWKNIYIEFQNDKEFLRIMEKLDTKKYNKTKQEASIGKSKFIKLWAVGSFWIVVFLLVFGTITFISLNVKWYTLLAILCFGQTVLTVIGAFIFKSIDDLSQESFLKLMRMSFQYQFKFLNVLSKKDKNIEQ